MPEADARSTKIARGVSIAAHPLILAGILVAVHTAARQGTRGALLVSAAFGAGLALPIVLFVRRQARTGRWSTVDASDRRERPALYTLASALLLVILCIAAVNPRYAFLARGTFGVLALFGVASLLNRWQKVSLHLAFATLVATSLAFVHPGFGVGFGLLVPLLAWSRLTLRRHTLPEVLIGALLGAVVGVAVSVL